MKYFLISALTLFIIAGGCALFSGIADGGGEVYEGTGAGYRGPVHAQVRVSEGRIAEITVDSEEDRLVGGAAIEELIDLVIEYNSTDVDAVTGATESSRGFLEAVENAIMKK